MEALLSAEDLTLVPHLSRYYKPLPSDAADSVLQNDVENGDKVACLQN
jgi:hypothetical protein